MREEESGHTCPAHCTCDHVPYDHHGLSAYDFAITVLTCKRIACIIGNGSDNPPKSFLSTDSFLTRSYVRKENKISYNTPDHQASSTTQAFYDRHKSTSRRRGLSSRVPSPRQSRSSTFSLSSMCFPHAFFQDTSVRTLHGRYPCAKM